MSDFRTSAARLVRDRQSTDRTPSLVVNVIRAGHPVYVDAVGLADPFHGHAATAGTSYRLGSITKTFTAALVMQLRDQGALDLDDPLSAHLEVPAHPGLPIRRLLSHLSGLQREPVGAVWDSPTMPDAKQLVADLVQAKEVLRPGRRWHYSNLAYVLLGQIVERHARAPWAEVLAERLLRPLGLTQTGVEPLTEHAQGCFVEPYTDRVHREPHVECNGLAPAGQLWSTVADLARWGTFLADPDPDVLAPETVREMCEPQVMADATSWTLGWGLGLSLHRHGDRVLAGHGGAMPGFLAGLAVDREQKISAAVLANTTSGIDPVALAGRLTTDLIAAEPATAELWRPATTDQGFVELVGRWWSEASEWTFRVSGGELQARRVGMAATAPWARFAPTSEKDRFRTVDGPNAGEWLTVRRTDSGEVAALSWATYGFDRQPRPFGRR